MLKAQEEIIYECRKDCTICNHPLVEEINKLKETQKITYIKLVEHINNKSEIKITSGSLCRHFSKMKKLVTAEVEKQRLHNYEGLQEKATTTLTYQFWTDKMLTRVFKRIWKDFDNMQFDISDLERLAKLRVMLKAGDVGAGQSIVDIFDKAAKKYNIDFDDNQLSLLDVEPKDIKKNAYEVQVSNVVQETTKVEDVKEKMSKEA